MEETAKQHWENVYQTKQPHEVSWTQTVPATSLKMIQDAHLAKDAAIIDVGGGDSNLVDFLLAEGYTNITVLDISEQAISRTKARLGGRAGQVNWAVSNIVEYQPAQKFEYWHDRAAFHFLTTAEDIERYKSIASTYVSRFMVIGAFSEDGPEKCSGLEIRQYSRETLSALFNDGFEIVNCFNEDHRTPFDTLQNFTFCMFSKIVTAAEV